MLFNSYYFVLYFLPAVLAGYFLLNRAGWHKAALAELTFASLFFYAYDNIRYVWILLASMGVNWTVSCIINRSSRDRIKKCLLAIGILLNIGLIFYFKYYDFFLSNLNRALSLELRLKNIALPLGISFFTFQQISYLVDTYRDETRDYDFIEYAAFLSFFPQLVAGPIVFHDEMIPQLRDKSRWFFSQESFAGGIYAFSIGMFKKVMLADTFGKAVSWGWASLEALSSVELILVTLSYTFQIYFDFSGYCDMAVGIARMFHLELPVNFDSPYKSLSPVDFWKRWHITLTRFLRKYIYFPLGGNRKGKLRTYGNILIVFLISGLWHGANWTFILWGGVYGAACVFNRIFQKAWNRCNQVFQWLCNFAFINVMWLIFRADSVQQAVYLLKRMVIMDSTQISEELMAVFVLPEIEAVLKYIKPLYENLHKINGFYMWLFLSGSLFICINLKNLYEKEFRPTKMKAATAAILLVWSILSFSGVSTFLYFNF